MCKKKNKKTYLLYSSIATLFDGIRAVSIDYPSSKSCAEMAANLLSRAYDLFGHCHRRYNSSHCMSDKDITDLGKVMT